MSEESEQSRTANKKVVKKFIEEKKQEGQASLLCMKRAGEQLRRRRGAPSSPMNENVGGLFHTRAKRTSLHDRIRETFNLIVKGKETRSHHFGPSHEQRFVGNKTCPLMLGRAE